MLTIESLFTSSHFFGPLRNIIDMTTSSISEPSKAISPQKQASGQSMSSSPSKEATRSGRRPRHKRVTAPEPGSLYDIMHDNCGASLYVLPICWTDVHVKLLGVRFVEHERITRPLPGPNLCGWDACPPAKTATDLGRELTTLVSCERNTPWIAKTQAIKAIMKTLFPDTMSHPKSNTELDLYFGDRVFRKVVRIPVLWKHSGSERTSFDSAVTQVATQSFDRMSTSQDQITPSSSPRSRSRPLLAYVNRRQLGAIRRNLYRICPGPAAGDQNNTPVRRLQQLRSSQLLPADEDHDAHYVGILIAMAQSHFYPQYTKSPSQSSPRFGGGKIVDNPPSDFSDVKVQLITHEDKSADLLVYTAVVTAGFLARFAQPTKASTKQVDGERKPVDSGLDITYVRVPVWPILGLKERLAKALGQDIAGYTALNEYGDESNDLECWLTREEKVQRQRILQAQAQRRIAPANPMVMGVKRRRAAESLSEIIVNSSFEADDDAASCASEDMPVLSPAAKRRCSRTVNPLQVC